MSDIALIYVRKSVVRYEQDRASPERQLANCVRVCDEKAWRYELYEDAEGHRSGRSEKGRPAWRELKRELASIPSGWALCDGGEHEGVITPDLRDSFVYGASNGEDPGATGGAATHSHTYSDLPQHTHTATSSTAGNHRHAYTYVSQWRQKDYDGGAYNYVPTAETTANTQYAGDHSHAITIDTAGQASPVTDDASTLPPFYKVAFIMKL